MKHLFLVHSHISYYLSISIIDKNNFKEDDVYFLLTRNYNNKYCKYKYLNIDYIAKELSPLTIKRLMFINRQINKIDTLIKNIVCDDYFNLYVPHMNLLISQILASNKKCVGLNYVEEGLAYYVEKNFYSSMLKYNKISKFIFNVYNLFSNRIELDRNVFGPFKRHVNPKYFYINSPYIPIFENVQTVDIIKDNSILIDDKIKYVLLLGATLEYNMASYENLYDTYNIILNEMEVESVLYVKKHPCTNDFTLKIINDICNNKSYKIEFIDFPIEQLLLHKTSQCIIAGIDSSLLFYAKILNNRFKIISAYNYLINVDSIYKKRCGIISLKNVFDVGINVL